MPTARSLRCRTLPLLLSALLLMQPARAQDAPELLLEVRLEQHLLSDGISAFEHKGDVLLPLGEVARLLTIAIRANPSEGQASGYILEEQRGFRLDLNEQVVVRNGERQPYNPALVRRRADDIYVAASLLARWLPADFEIDMASLSLKVRAREKLPLQARLERQGKGRADAASAAIQADPGYARVATPYRLARMPFADQTIGVDWRRSPGQGARSVGYTAYATSDLLGAEAALYINRGEDVRGPVARLTLGRHDPDANLLGPLRARTVQVGSVSGAGVPNIAQGSAPGNGLLVSNRALGLPARFDRHNLQGDLPPGWDVELYFNEALIGFQQSRPDGRYSFNDQPLIYGANVFRLGGWFWLLNTWPSYLWLAAGIAAGLLGAGAGRLFDEPMASVVDTLPRALWWRTVARSCAAPSISPPTSPRRMPPVPAAISCSNSPASTCSCSKTSA